MTPNPRMVDVPLRDLPVLVNRQDDEAARYFRQGGTLEQIAGVQHRTRDQVQDSLDRVADARARCRT